MCIETKGTDNKDLFVIQHRSKKEHETPIKQTWDYMGKIGLDYGICTNYKHFVLITKEFGYSKYHFFNFKSIKNNKQKLREFIGIFSRERIIDLGFVEKLQKESIIQERDITKEFYTLFHTTRLMLIKVFQMGFHKEFPDEDVARNKAIRATQIFLNRLIFIFFVADRGFIPDTRLFTNRILNLLESGQSTEHSTKIYDDIKELFVAFDKGSRLLSIFGFNGGMFDEKIFDKVIPKGICFSDIKNEKFFDEFKESSQLVKSIKLNENVTQIISKIPDLNPIIPNLLRMDSYDFNTDINVNILGHIFEQSISDLEKLREEGISQRKKDGVYYTPEHITDYICRNTIIPYLSKSNVSTVSELINEYLDSVDELEDKFKKIKILDPACGSGAFLIKAIDILLEIHKEIQNLKTVKQHHNEQSQITKEWNEDKEIRTIIENNIYGVDINSESIEITKLSLFLKLASNERKLIGLSKNILQGNSLLDDKKITPNAFSWTDKFPEILGSLMDARGFNVVVGNPPYFNLASDGILKNCSDYSLLTNGVLNVSSLFLKKGVDLLLNDGYLGFIIPKSFLTVESWKPIRDFVLKHSLIQVNDVGQQWADVGLEQTIIVVMKNPEQVNTKILAKFQNIANVSQKLFKKRGVILTGLSEKKLELIEKIEKDSTYLNTIAEMPRGITVKASTYISENKNNFVQVLGGTNIERFLIKDGNKRKPNKFLQSDDSRVLSKKEIFDQRRILYQNIASSVPKIVSTIIESKLPTDDTINNLILTNKEYIYEDILAILNSDLITFYLRYAIINNSELTVHLDKQYLGKIPIKNPKGSLSKIISNILKNKEIMHNHNKKFFNRIQEHSPNVTISEKLETYYEMNFSEFIKELKKNKAEFTLKQKDEWEDYFNDHSHSALKLSEEMENDIEKINNMVFKLYRLSKGESKIIQSTLYPES